MRKIPFLNFIAIIIGTAIAIIQMESCANIVPPSGGPRDSLPPYLVAAKPHDSSLHIEPKEIVIAFNEFIVAQALQENLIISPSIKTTPLIDAKLNMLRIRLNDTLLKNTTYSLKFGDAIKDVNEGNIFKDFTYVFSTGDYIDSGSFKGNVHIAETGEVDSTLIVVLHPANKDSAIYKNKPVYYTKINGQGKFEFKFLPNQLFNVYVVPNDYTKKYDDSTKAFAFLNQAISITHQTDTQNLYVFEAYKKIEKIKSTAAANTKNAKKPAPYLKYGKSLEANEQDLLSTLKINFETPIQLNDSFPILLCDTLYKPINDVTIRLDTATHRVITIDHKWIESSHFKLIIPKNAFKDTANITLVKNDTLSFVTKSEASYGTALIRVNGYTAYKNPILLLTQDNKVKFSLPIKQAIVRVPLLPPGDYRLKLLSDENNNGYWDNGKYGLIKQQPEIVTLLSTILAIKPNRDNELTLSINK